MSDSVRTLIGRLSSVGVAKETGSFVEKLGHVLLREEANRLLIHLDNVRSGHFGVNHAAQLSTLIDWCSGATKDTSWHVVVAEHLLVKLPEALRRKTLELLLDLFRKPDSILRGNVQLISTSLFKIVENPMLLQLGSCAALCGLKVGVVATHGPRNDPPFALTVSSKAGGITISPGQTDDHITEAWSVRAWGGQMAQESVTADVGQGTREAFLSIPTAAVAVAKRISGTELSPQLSVTDLFGDLICLRDLQPRTQRVRGLDSLREPLGIAAPLIPRKSETDYARVVYSFAQEIGGANPRMIYVGDTAFNDGSVICNLDEQRPGEIFGFLCNEKGFSGAGDFVLGPIYFGNRWRSLTRFAQQCIERSIPFDEHTVAFFDLDQTVYAAKGRDDAPLHQARWEAIQAFLKDTIAFYKFDPQRAERIYRQFDRDEYHRVTRDNMDYVVLLVLAVAAGLSDAKEIEAFAVSPDNSISSLTELLHLRATALRDHEDIVRVLDVIRAVHYNTLAGDQTPCKDFRRYECLATAAKMSGEAGNADRIQLNREVVEFIRFLKDQNVQIFAVSDRPVEAAVDDAEGAKRDLMTIPMRVRGFSIIDGLRSVR